MTVSKEVQGIFISPLHNNTLTTVPVFDSRKDARNYMAVVQESGDVTLESKFSRFWMERNRGVGYYYIFYKKDGVITSLKVGDAVEFGSKLEVGKGVFEKNYWWGCVSSLTESEIRIMRTESPVHAMQLGEGIRESLQFAAETAEAPDTSQIRLLIQEIEQKQESLVQEWHSLEAEKKKLLALLSESKG